MKGLSDEIYKRRRKAGHLDALNGAARLSIVEAAPAENTKTTRGWGLSPPLPPAAL